MKNIIIFGASRGLGAAFSLGLPTLGDIVWLVSRTRPESLDKLDGVARHWIQADLAVAKAAAETIGVALATQRIDVLIYNAGIWEAQAFERHYAFESVSQEETETILAVNLTTPILCIQKLLPNLLRSEQAKVILIGSTSGLENTGVPEVAYTASKFGLRGLGHALREYVRPYGMTVTCINPGNLAATVPYESGIDQALAAYGGSRIPVHDVVALVNCVMNLSKAACIKEIDMPAMTDRMA